VAPYATTSSGSLSPIQLNNQSKSYYNLSSSYPNHNYTSSSFEIIEFQNSHIIGDQFDDSTISTFENLKQLVADTTDHNQISSILESVNIEGDCKEGPSSKMIKHDEDPKLTQLFTILLQQITQLSSQNITIQDQLRDNEHKISTKFQMVVQENESFRQSMRSELDELHNLISSHSQTISPSHLASLVSSSSSTVNSSTSSNNESQSQPSTPGITAIVSLSVPISSDLQANMLLMLAESLTKLTSVLSDKSDFKSSDWPKFSGDQK
jgi:uncharacterized protein YfkK (UPF0435 family)